MIDPQKRDVGAAPPTEPHSLEYMLQTLRQTEQAFAQVCEELRRERQRTGKAVRCMNQYRRLYELARAKEAGASSAAQASSPRRTGRHQLALVKGERRSSG